MSVARRIGELGGLAIVGGACYLAVTDLGRLMVVASILAFVSFGVWLFMKIIKR